MTTLPFAAPGAPVLAPTHDEIARCAYELWSQAGSPEGQDEAIWLEAERRMVSAGSNESDLTTFILQTLRQPAAGKTGRRIRGS